MLMTVCELECTLKVTGGEVIQEHTPNHKKGRERGERVRESSSLP